MHHQFKYIQPENLQEASKYTSDYLLYAGGTDVLGLLKNDLLHPKYLVNLKNIAGLNEIEYHKGKGLTIGALATLYDVSNNKLINGKYQILAQAAGEAASPQLRNVGTIGGNLCQRPRCWYFRGDFPCLRKGGDECFAAGGENKYHCVIGGGPCFIVHPSDTAVALLALNASLEIYANGKTRNVPINRFFVLPEEDHTKENILQPGEIITAIHIPDPAQNQRSVFVKFRERAAWDFAIVSVGLVYQRSGDRINKGSIVFGGVAPIPWFDESINSLLNNLSLTEKDIKNYVNQILKYAEAMEQNGYKITLTKNITRNLLENLPPYKS